MAATLPDYVASAQAVPPEGRIPWFKSTAQTYAGIMLWFVFWDSVPVGSALGRDYPMYSETAGGTLAQGVGIALLGLVLAALLCHFFYYLVPGLLGMKTGLPLYIVGTSTYGVVGGFLMPGLLMGLLQFGWLGVNSFFSSWLLVTPFYDTADAALLSGPHKVVAAVFAILAALVGLKGIQYVARVATWLPLIPLAILVILFAFTVGGTGEFSTVRQQLVDQERSLRLPDGNVTGFNPALSTWGVIGVMLTYVIGFFATAGAAGADFGMNNRHAKDVQFGGLFGIALATVVAGGLSLLIVAGAYGTGAASPENPAVLTTYLMDSVVSPNCAQAFKWLLAIAAFPPACFSSFIAANSFKTTLPKVNPFISIGAGTAAAIALAISGVAGDVKQFFDVIGASFGPVCGAMIADYVLAGGRWAGPRAAFNPAGWISWIVGFIVGAASFIPLLDQIVPVPPLSALVVAFLLYYILAKLGLQTKTLEMPPAPETPAAEAG